MQLHPTTESESSSVPPTFDVLPLSHEVRKAVDALGYTHPTPVQRAVFDSVAAGKDVVVQARTGTGKTAAFGLPVVDRIVDIERKKPQVLVLCPTRELALQIHRELELLGKFKGVSVAAIYGGAAINPQIDAIAGGAQIIAGTPGRVLDHLERGTLKAKSITALVLDESDEMLSMGFLPQFTKIMEQLPTGHQTLLFSATLPPDVKRIADSRLKAPEFITLSGDHVGALSIEHYVYRSTGRKAEELVQLVEIENPESAIIFCNTRDQTKTLAGALQKQGYAADWLNADLSQKDREKVMSATREGRLRFLVCTDVAARGIDISHLTHVINADFPESTENYVHRTGRTGRAGRTGTAISLITPQDVGNLYMLRLTYKIFPVERDLPRPLELRTRRETDLVQFLIQAFSTSATGQTDRSLAKRVLSSDQAELIVAGLLADHLGAHPKAADTASALRREALPAAQPVESEDKRKKKKKKKDKLRTDARGDTDDELEPSSADAPAKVDVEKPRAADHERRAAGQEPRAAEPPAVRRSPSNNSAGVGRSRERTEARREPPHTQQDGAAVEFDDAALLGLSGGADLEEMDVISAADLLSAEERALLRGDTLDVTERDKPAFGHAPPNNHARVFVNVGADDEVTEEDFLDTLADTGFPIGRVLGITIRPHHTFIIVPRELLSQALDCLNAEDVAGLQVRAEEARAKKPGRPSPSRDGRRSRDRFRSSR
jgi:ATP-dependent RNA helicase DeaD